MHQPPLRNLRVLDFSRVVSGPFCTQLLADMGADVIKVEPPGGDDTRQFGPPFVNGVSTYFVANNRGKRSLVLDLKKETAREVVADLVRWAEVMVVNYRPGVAEKLGVDYPVCAKLNSDLIYVNISGFGLRGIEEISKLPGYDLVLQGMGGMPSLTGPAEGGPYKMAGSIADILAALHAYGALTTALLAQARGGEGRLLDISMYDSQLASLMYHATAWLNAKESTKRQGNAHQSLCPYETMEASDGYFNLACGNNQQFRLLCRALNEPQLCADERFLTNAQRVANRKELLGIIEPHFKARTVQECLDLLEGASVPSGPIQTVAQALEHPQTSARDMIVEQAHRMLGQVKTVGSALGFEQSSFASLPPPALGEHSISVLEDLLGYDSGKVQMLTDSGSVIALADAARGRDG